MENLIVALIIIGILSLSILKIISEKRKGVKCIGCPHSGSSKKSGGQVVQLDLHPKS